MEFKELTAELDKFKDTDDYNNYIGGFVTADRVSKYLETDDGKKLLQPTLDKYHTKGLETWKSNNLQKLVDDEVKKRFPEADPKDTELAKIKHELEQMKQESTRKELTNAALKTATEKHLPIELVDYFIGMDTETTAKNLEILEKVFNQSVSASVDEKIKGTSHVPAKGDPESLSGVEKAFYSKNPNLKK